MSVVEWAERFRVLSKESSRGGAFRVRNREIARGPLMAATERGVSRITAMVCTQLFKTTLMECVIGHRIHLNPCPMLVVYPDEKAAKMFSNERLSPMVRDTSVLRPLFSIKSRDSANSWDSKAFPGGVISMATARSPMDLSARPIGLLVCDEMGRFPESSGKEGDPIFIAEERMAEYRGVSLSLRCGSPTVAGHCPIESSFLESDQRKAFVRCPSCGESQTLEWPNVKGEGGKAFGKTLGGGLNVHGAALYCPTCAHPWTEAQRLIALQTIEWRQTRMFDCCGLRQNPERWSEAGRAECSQCGRAAVPNDHAGFTASKLYAPNQSVAELARKFARAYRKGPQGLKAFYNTQLAQTWKEDAEAPEWQAVFNKRDRYPSRQVPRFGLILFAGVDIQKDRIEVGVYAFGRNRQRYFVEHRVLPGAVYSPEPWAALRAMMDETWRHESGAEMQVNTWGVDSGAFTPEVAKFVRSMAGLANVHAVDGRDDYTAAYVGLGSIEVDQRGKKVKRGLATIKVGVSFCKQELLGAWALPRPEIGHEFPPGFVHLPDDVGEENVKQLTSEELQTVVKRGRSKREWIVLPGRRNEVLDCCNYARGIAAFRGWERWREKDFRKLEGLIGLEASGGNAVEMDGRVVRDDDPKPISQRALATVKKRPRVMRSNFMRR